MCRTLLVTQHQFLFEYIVAWPTANNMTRQRDFTFLRSQNTGSANQQHDLQDLKSAGQKAWRTKRCEQFLNASRRPHTSLRHCRVCAGLQLEGGLAKSWQTVASRGVLATKKVEIVCSSLVLSEIITFAINRELKKHNIQTVVLVTCLTSRAK